MSVSRLSRSTYHHVSSRRKMTALELPVATVGGPFMSSSSNTDEKNGMFPVYRLNREPYHGFSYNLITLLGFAVNRFVLSGCADQDKRHTASRMLETMRPTVAARKRGILLSSRPNLAEQRGKIRKADTSPQKKMKNSLNLSNYEYIK